MEAFSVVGTRFFAAAIDYTSIRHNEPSLSHNDYGALRRLCFHTSSCPLMTSHKTSARSSN